MPQVQPNTHEKRGFFARLFSGRADMGEKYNVRVTFTRLFDKKNRDCVAWLWRASEGFHGRILALAIVSCIITFTGVRLALVSKAMLDAVQMGDLDGFIRSAIILVCVTIVVQGANLVTGYFIELTSQQLLKRLRVQFFHELVSKDYGEVSRASTQDLINRLMGDTGVAVSTMIKFPINLVLLLTTFITAVSVLFELEPIFIIIAAVSVVPGIVMQRFSMPIVREFAQVERAINVRIGAFLQENIMQMSVVRAFGTLDRSEQHADEVFGSQKNFVLDRTTWNNQVGALRLLYGIVTGTGLTIYCGYRILMGTMTYGSMGALATIFGQVREPLKNLFSLLPQLISSFIHVDRLMEIDSFADQVGEIASEDEAHAFYEDELVSFGLADAWFTYPAVAKDSVETADEAEEGEPDREPVLNGFSIEIKKGEITAITGISGYGKSTIVKALLGLYTLDQGERFATTRTQGRIPLTSRYQRLFAYVPQGNLLTRGTIREVVSFGTEMGGTGDERLWDALRLACADDFVAELPGGLDANLGELGSGLSEGQMQRISIARAIFSGHPILMLDESTSALDGQTEERLLTNLRDLSGHTVVVVTHRQSVVDICDQNLHFGAEEL